VYVAEPGVAPAALARGTSAGGRLLCVAAVTPGKGHDVLLAGLAHVRDLPWRLVCAGSVDIDPDLVERLRARARESGIAHRVRFAGALVGDDLDAAYAATDALVLASRAETYGLVVVEALARGVPVIGTAVGGLPEALGSAADGTRPGLLVPPDDPAALGDAVRLWLTDAGVRNRLRRAADDRRTNLSGWSHTVEGVSRVLSAVGVDG
jgi:glycosyltransferase involved in cell wall biosynthesis